MAKKQNKKVVTVSKSKKKLVPTSSKEKANVKVRSAAPDELIFGRQNYIYMLAGAALITLGLICMIGGSMPDPNTWDPDIIYSKRITFVAPMLILTGLIVEIYAIFKK